MTLDEIFCNTFKALRRKWAPVVKKEVDFMLPSMPMVKVCQADEADFFLPYIEKGILTTEQMHNAAHRFFLGKSKTGKPIFWMIDDMVMPLDGLIGEDVWVSQLLKKRDPITRYWRVKHCLFGLHQIATLDCPASNICIVEKPTSAIILSEIFPETLWLSVMAGTYFTIDLLKPLKGCKIKVFPHTDSTLSNYVTWLDLADMARKAYHLDIKVSYYLEENATASQKSNNIDLLDFLYDKS